MGGSGGDMEGRGPEGGGGGRSRAHMAFMDKAEMEEMKRRVAASEGRIALSERSLEQVLETRAIQAKDSVTANADLEGQLVDARGAIDSLKRQLAAEAHSRGTVLGEQRREMDELRRQMAEKDASFSSRIEALQHDHRRSENEGINAEAQMNAFQEDKTVHEQVVVSNRLRRAEVALTEERRERLAFEKALSEQIELRLSAAGTAVDRDTAASDVRSRELLTNVERKLKDMDSIVRCVVGMCVVGVAWVTKGTTRRGTETRDEKKR